MRFCMVTTFFGGHSFGGDAAYVERLSLALARRGHEVEVVHCADAFHAVAGSHPLRSFEPVDGVEVHTLHSRVGMLSPLWSHQTGRLGPKSRGLRSVLERRDFDVVHFHNVSLMGAPQVLRSTDRSGHAIRLMTAHEYWLVCPMHSLWKNDREVCERPQCVRCSLQGRRPPQAWRRTSALSDALEGLDALICPSRHAVRMHRARGITRPIVHLPYFLPDDWAGVPGPVVDSPRSERPYVAAAGRFVRWKGFRELIELMDRLPDVDLRLAGMGPRESELRELAAGRPNVELVGLLPPSELARLFRGARAVVVPSLGYETFGYVVLEAFSAGAPVVVRRGGALTELVDESGGGIAYETDEEAIDAIAGFAGDDALRRELAEAGAAALRGRWSESTQFEAYLELVDRLRVARAA